MNVFMSDLDPNDRQVLDACNELHELSLMTVAALAERVGAKHLYTLMWGVARYRYRNCLSANEIARLVQIRTLQENQTEGIGSTTIVPVLIKALRNVSSDLADEMEEWALHTTNNPYVPFGTWNSCRKQVTSAADYHELIRLRDKRNDAIEHAKRELAELRRASRAAKHQDRLEVQRKSRAIRTEMIKVVQTEPNPTNRLAIIANDAAHPPYYFSDNFADVSDDALAELNQEVALRLLSKLVTCPRGKWVQLRRRLEKLGEL